MLNYILSLAKKHTDSIGFIPRDSVERYLLAGQVISASENDEPCGFLIFGNGYPRLKIYQACVQYDAQRRAHGLEMVSRIIALASRRGCDAVSLWCADDLPANQFWEAAGFQRLKVKPGGQRRGRMVNLWVYWLPQNCLPGLVSLRVAESGAAGQAEDNQKALARLHSGGSLNRSHACTAEGGGSSLAPLGRRSFPEFVERIKTEADNHRAEAKETRKFLADTASSELTPTQRERRYSEADLRDALAGVLESQSREFETTSARLD